MAMIPWSDSENEENPFNDNNSLGMHRRLISVSLMKTPQLLANSKLLHVSLDVT